MPETTVEKSVRLTKLMNDIDQKFENLQKGISKKSYIEESKRIENMTANYEKQFEKDFEKKENQKKFEKKRTTQRHNYKERL